MKAYIIILCSLGALYLSSGSPLGDAWCRRFCHQKYFPICAAEGIIKQTFHNSCIMEKINICERSAFKKIHDGPCKKADIDHLGLKHTKVPPPQ